jgi:hypothetical protein
MSMQAIYNYNKQKWVNFAQHNYKILNYLVNTSAPKKCFLIHLNYIQSFVKQSEIELGSYTDLTSELYRNSIEYKWTVDTDLNNLLVNLGIQIRFHIDKPNNYQDWVNRTLEGFNHSEIDIMDLRWLSHSEKQMIS